MCGCLPLPPFILFLLVLLGASWYKLFWISLSLIPIHHFKWEVLFFLLLRSLWRPAIFWWARMACNMSRVTRGKCEPREPPWSDSVTRSSIYKFVIDQIPSLFTIIISDLYSDLCAHMYVCDMCVCVCIKNHSLVWGIQSPKLSFFPAWLFFTVLSVHSTLFMDCFRASLIFFSCLKFNWYPAQA